MAGSNNAGGAAFPAGSPLSSAHASATGSSAPTSQLAAALVGIGPIHAGEHGASGGQGVRLTIALAPPAIGMVTLRIDRNADGSSTVAIGASHAATLDQLRNDRSALEQMLTQAGIPADHRAVAFHLIATHAEASLSPQAGGGGAAGFGFGAGGQGNSQPRGSGGAPAGAPMPNLHAGSPDGEVAASVEAPLHVTSLRRFGVNVMA